jgi:sensor histidine kinase YesM
MGWLADLEKKADTWALSRMEPEMACEARELDARLKRDWRVYLPRYGGRYIASIAFLTGALMLMKDTSDWLGALLMANLLALCVIVVSLSAWYGYRKWTGPRARRAFLTFFGMMVFGGLAVLVADALLNDRSLAQMAPRKLSTLLGATLLMGFVMFALLASIANLRQREADHRMALLKAEAEQERLARAGVQAELKLLQAQVEPHFLFNTLANLRQLIQSDPARATSMLDHLIHYLRTALPEIRAEDSTVGREVQLARSYLEILRIRMGGALEVHTRIAPELESHAFPPMVVLTLVENAVKHGVGPVGRGMVTIDAERAGDCLRITVEDDGRGLGGSIGQGVGLTNVRERLLALYGSAARLDLASREGGGTRASVEVPA